MVAVAIVMDFKGATLEQYDKVVELMQLTPEGAGAGGACSTGSPRRRMGSS
jgi:hypothetical protein